jgi:hypothetical protein
MLFSANNFPSISSEYIGVAGGERRNVHESGEETERMVGTYPVEGES